MRRASLLLFLALLSCGGQVSPSNTSAAGQGGQGGAGGSGGSGQGGAGSGQSGGAGGVIDDGKAKLPCDVERVLAKHCHECHGSKPSFGAPSPLVTYDDLDKKAATEPDSYLYELLLERIKSSKDPMPPPPRQRLTLDEVAIISKWLDDTAPARPKGEVCPPVEEKPPQPPPSCEPTVKLSAKSKWKMPKDVVDRYVCYGVELEGGAEQRQITGIVPLIDNAAIVHHLLLFTMDKPQPTDPHPCDEIFPIDGKAIYAWAPGGPPYLLPEAAGFPTKGKDPTHLMVQVHYSNLQKLDGQEDASQIGLCLTDKPRAYEADIMWVGGYDFKLPPHKTSTVQCTFDFKDAATQSLLPIHVFQAWPHMHQLGTRLESVLMRPDGSKTGLGLADPYSFSDQIVYPVQAEIYPGDKIATTCTWNNTTDQAVKWGEATSEEMCFNLLAYYPRIKLPQYGSPAAAYLSECQMMP